MYFATATYLVRAGFSIIPIEQNGKRPAFELLPTKEVNGKQKPSWEAYLTRCASSEELEDWFVKHESRIGLVAGSISGAVGVIDFDDPKLIKPWMEKIESEGLKYVLDSLVQIDTPSGGCHFYYRCPEGAGATHKLAMTADSVDTLIELKAEGGYVLVPPCEGYIPAQGSMADIPVIGTGVRDILLNAARSFDLRPKKAKPVEVVTKSKNAAMPGDDFILKTTWADVLIPAGWCQDEDDPNRWRRPGKSSGTHADVVDNGEKLRVFSDSDSMLKQGQYSRFQAYTYINHGGNFHESAQALRKQGFGKQNVTSEKNEIDWTDPNSFGEPVFFDALKVPDLDTSVLPSWCADFAAAVAESTQTPIGLAVMLALPIMGVTVQKKFEVAPKGLEDDYREPLNIWTLVALMSGNRKSEVFRLLMAPLVEWQNNQLMLMSDEIEANRDERKIIDKKIDVLLARAAQADEELDALEYKARIAELRKKKPAELRVLDLFATDATPEAFRDYLYQNNGRGAILSDEAGIFETISGLYSGGKSNIDVFLQCHSKGTVKAKRGGTSPDLPDCAASIGLSPQPAVLAELTADGSKKLFRGKGLLARFLYAIPESLVGSRDVFASNPIPDRLKGRYSTCIKTLLDTKADKDVFGSEKPWDITFSADAKNTWLLFAKWIEERQGPGGEFESIADYTGKLPGACARIAALKHLGEYGSAHLEVQAHTVTPCIEFCKKLIIHAQYAFGLMSYEPVVADAKFALDWICKNYHKNGNGAYFFKQNELHKSSRFSHSKFERVKKALDVLIERNLISEPMRIPASGRGRPFFASYILPTVIKGTDMNRITNVDGTVILQEGDKARKVPSAAALRERLIKLLEEVGGDINHPTVAKFWADRAEALNTTDPVDQAWEAEVYQRMETLWEELTPPKERHEETIDMSPDPVTPPEVDIFAEFGV